MRRTYPLALAVVALALLGTTSIETDEIRARWLAYCETRDSSVHQWRTGEYTDPSGIGNPNMMLKGCPQDRPNNPCSVSQEACDAAAWEEILQWLIPQRLQ